jgi:hypothetical protein
MITALLAPGAAGDERELCQFGCQLGAQRAPSDCPVSAPASDPVYYIIMGNSPHQEFLRLPLGGETVVDALKHVGGFAMHCKKNIYVARCASDTDDEIMALPVNCEAIAQGGDATNYELRPNDRVFVVPRLVLAGACAPSTDCEAVANGQRDHLVRQVAAECPLAKATCASGDGQSARCNEVTCDSAVEKSACARSGCANSACDKTACDAAKTCATACEERVCDRAASAACSAAKRNRCCDGTSEVCSAECKCDNAATCVKSRDTACQPNTACRQKCESTHADAPAHPVLELADKLAPSPEGIFCPGLVVNGCNVPTDEEIAERRAQLVEVLRELEQCSAAEEPCPAPEEISAGPPVAHPFQADALRQTASALEHAAAHLEEAQLYDQADQVRRLAEQLRHDSRQAAAQLRAGYFMSALPAQPE